MKIIILLALLLTENFISQNTFASLVQPCAQSLLILQKLPDEALRPLFLELADLNFQYSSLDPENVTHVTLKEALERKYEELSLLLKDHSESQIAEYVKILNELTKSMGLGDVLKEEEKKIVEDQAREEEKNIQAFRTIKEFNLPYDITEIVPLQDEFILINYKKPASSDFAAQDAKLIFDTHLGKVITDFNNIDLDPNPKFKVLSVSPGAHFVSVHLEKYNRYLIYDTQKDESILEVDGASNQWFAPSVKYSSKGDLAAFVDQRFTIIKNLKTLEEHVYASAEYSDSAAAFVFPLSVKTERIKDFRGFDFNPDGKTYALQDGLQISVMDMATHAEIKKIHIAEDPEYNPRNYKAHKNYFPAKRPISLQFDSTGTKLVSFYDFKTYVIDLQTGLTVGEALGLPRMSGDRTTLFVFLNDILQRQITPQTNTYKNPFDIHVWDLKTNTHTTHHQFSTAITTQKLQPSYHGNYYTFHNTSVFKGHWTLWNKAGGQVGKGPQGLIFYTIMSNDEKFILDYSEIRRPDDKDGSLHFLNPQLKIMEVHSGKNISFMSDGHLILHEPTLKGPGYFQIGTID